MCKLRILSVIGMLIHGGAESVAVNLAIGMPQHKHMIIHFSSFVGLPPSKYLIDKLRVGNIPDMEIDPNVLKQSNVAQQILSEFKPDIVLYHWTEPSPAIELLIKKMKSYNIEGKKTKLICVVHSSLPVTRGYDFYVLPCKDNNSCQRHIPENKKRVIYNGIDVDKFDIPRLRGDDNKFVTGRVSTLLERKIPRDWIEVANKFDIPNVKFVILGEGPRRAELLSDVRLLGLEEKFSLPGYISQENLPYLLSTFDTSCYITGGWVEVHALALLEYATAGLPIVSQPRGGVSEQVIHGETGFLSDDMNEIRYYCELLAKDSSLRQEMSRKAREFGRQFSIERQCLAYGRLFEEIIEDK